MNPDANQMPAQMDKDAREDPRWRSVLDRDAAADGAFVYGVRTTGVYCRPSCPSRRARPENVTFFETPSCAEVAGFRPCLRCKPQHPEGLSPRAQIVDRLRRAMEAADTPPTLAQLSKVAGLSPFHLQRIFRHATGLSPHQYARAIRAERLRTGLRAPGASVTTAFYEAGFGSGAGFYRESNEVLGMSPKQFRAGGAGATIRIAIADSSLGAVLVASSERGVCAVAMGEDPETLLRDFQDGFPEAELIAGDRDFEGLVARVIACVETPGLRLDMPLDMRGTAFQRSVWQELLKIPAGSTASYTDIAKRIGAPNSVRAVAGACGANKIAVLVPCHRIVRRDGALSGYRWGVERKRELLERERDGAP